MLVPMLRVERDERGQIEETEMTTRLDHEFFNFANIPSQGKGCKAEEWDGNSSLPPFPALPPCPSFPAFLTAALLHPPSHGEGNMPHGKSREAGRAGLLQKELTQHWERPSCNKAQLGKPMLSNKAQRLPSRPVPSPQRPARPSRTQLVLAPSSAPTHLSTHLAAPCLPAGHLAHFPLSFWAGCGSSSFLSSFPHCVSSLPPIHHTLSQPQSPFSCNFYITSPSVLTACLQGCLSSWSMLVLCFDLPSFHCSLKNLPISPPSPPHPSPLARLFSSPATIPPVDMPRMRILH